MFKRTLNIFNDLTQGSSFLLLGPRGVGKSKYSNDLLSNYRESITFNLLERKTFLELVNNTSNFIHQIEAKISLNSPTRTIVFVDEIQKLPELLDEVHYLIEKHPSEVSFLLTGSSARKLRRTGVNLLAGRALTSYLFPFTFEEAPLVLEKVLQYGALPKVITDQNKATEYLTSYVDTYLKEEVFQEALVRRMTSFSRFLEIAAQYNGEFVNFARIGKAAGVSGNTVKQFFSVLEDTLIVTRLDSFVYSTIKQLRESPKYYFFDCGVLNAIRSELLVSLRPSTSRYGKLFETFVINELFKKNSYYKKAYKFYHWHTQNDVEVDLVMSHGSATAPIAIEIKSTASPGKSDLRGLKAFSNLHPGSKLYLFCQTQKEFIIEGIKIVPWEVGIEEVFKLDNPNADYS